MKKLLLALVVVAACLGVSRSVEAAQADLSWSNPSGAQVRVERRDSLNAADPFVVQTTLAAGATSFSQVGLPKGSDHCYRLVATSDFGDAPNVAGDEWPVICGNSRRPGNVNGIILIIRPEAGE